MKNEVRIKIHMSDFIHLYEPLIKKRELKHVLRACFLNKAQSRPNYYKLRRKDLKTTAKNLFLLNLLTGKCIKIKY